MNRKIVVVGSTNIDIVAQVAHLPLPGETVGDAKLTTCLGGKGANQAVAAARAGADVTFVSCVGDDDNGRWAVDSFAKDGINTDSIIACKNINTGTALIFVDEGAENCIVISPGANYCLDEAVVNKFKEIIKQASIVIMQLEIPYSTVKAVARLAKSNGVKVLLNPAPAKAIDKELLSNTDYLILNETEASIISGIELNDNNISQVAQAIKKQGVENLIITLGKQGSFIFAKDLEQHVNSFKVEAVDTTAAGDTYCGAFAKQIAEGKDIVSAVKYASAAAAISVTRLGAQPSCPKAQEIDEFLLKH